MFCELSLNKESARILLPEQVQKEYVKIQGACRKIRGVSEHY